MRTVAIIPCHNEGKFIYQVASKAAKHVSFVVVVDNLSADNTVSEARRADAAIVYCRGKGVGCATQAGLDSGYVGGADAVVLLDGDGQHDPDEIPSLLAPVLRGYADVAIGVRTYWSSMPHYRQIGNWVIEQALNVGASVKAVDAQCGFRALGKKALQIRLTDPGFGSITELLVRARRAQLRIAYVPVRCIYHDALADNSSMHPVKHGFVALFRTLRWRAWEHLGI